MDTRLRLQSMMQDKEMPYKFRLLSTHVLYIIAVPAFFLFFMAVYKPFDLDDILSAANVSFTFNCIMIMCILLAVMLVSRLSVYFTRLLKRISSIGWYRALCVLEIVASSFFVSMYVQLVMKTGYQYLEVLVRTGYYLFFILLVPYVMAELAFTLSSERNKEIIEEHTDENKLRFYDSRHNLKFVVNAEMVLFIRSEENYIMINYLEGDKAKEYELRSSMKSVELMCAENGILRCHRSYFINPLHIKALRKERENVITAELDLPGLAQIPVSKRYFDDIAASL